MKRKSLSSDAWVCKPARSASIAIHASSNLGVPERTSGEDSCEGTTVRGLDGVSDNGEEDARSTTVHAGEMEGL